MKVKELLDKLNIKDSVEFFTPNQPFKRKLHIEVINTKEDITNLKGKTFTDVEKLEVDYNVKDGSVTKISNKHIPLRLKDYKFYRLKAYADKIGRPIRRLNEETHFMFGIPNIDLRKLHERIFYVVNMKHNRLAVVVGVNYRRKVKKDESGKESVICDTGDISMLYCNNDRYFENVMRIVPRKLRLPRLRLIRTESTRGMLDNEWYRQLLLKTRWLYCVNGDYWIPTSYIKQGNYEILDKGTIKDLSLGNQDEKSIQDILQDNTDGTPNIEIESRENHREHHLGSREEVQEQSLGTRTYGNITIDWDSLPRDVQWIDAVSFEDWARLSAEEQQRLTADYYIHRGERETSDERVEDREDRDISFTSFIERFIGINMYTTSIGNQPTQIYELWQQYRNNTLTVRETRRRLVEIYRED